MHSPREIRRRIRSVRNTSQITKAMEMVSAAKLRRAQSAVQASRPYAELMRALISSLGGASGRGEEVHPLLQKRPVRVQLLPVEPPVGEEGAQQYGNFLFEPSPEEVLAQLLPRDIAVQIYQALLESLASEQSARMIAMHNATENAKDIVRSLTLTYNKARQAGITKEILEISGGAEALRQAS